MLANSQRLCRILYYIDHILFSILGAFLLPYFLFLILGGIPLVFLEMTIGQYSSAGPTMVWRVAPIFKGMATHSC